MIRRNVTSISEVHKLRKSVERIEKSKIKKLIKVIGNFIPNLIVLGHADQISNETLNKIKDQKK